MLIDKKEVLNEDGSLGYVDAVFDSDNILKTTYFFHTKRLYISFKRGGTYSYENVPYETYLQLESSESQGKFFHQNIRNNPEYSFRKEFNLNSNEIDELKRIIDNTKHKKAENCDE